MKSKNKGKKRRQSSNQRFIDNKKRKRSDSKEKKEDETEFKSVLSTEAYERKSIFDFSELSINENKFNNYSHFDRKKIVEDYLNTQNNNNNTYTFDELLFLDDTNKKLQIKYIEIIVDRINKEKDLEKIKIYEEKILKSLIIIDEDNYNKIIDKISNENLKKKLTYINYKTALKDSLRAILNKNDEKKNNDKENDVKKNDNKKNDDNKNDDKKIKDPKEELKLSKRFNFNKWADIGENNYYFYLICLRLFDKMEEILFFYSFYENILKELLLFLEKEDFNTLVQDTNKKFRYNYILYIVLDPGSIKSEEESIKINNFLYGERVTPNDLENLFSNEKKYEYNKLKGLKFQIEYNKKKKKIYFKITDNRRINSKNFSYTLSKSYKINSFNKNLLKLIEEHFTPNFESNLMEHTMQTLDDQLIYYNKLIPLFIENLKRILKSNSAKKFFAEKYQKNYKNLQYHFDRDEVLDEIIKRINFYPIFNDKDNGFTNPIDMHIIINSIPGKMGNPGIHTFNRIILDLGLLLVVGLHEILGHFMRRYYSFLTGRIINFDTPDFGDDYTDKESGFFIESKFIGLNPGQSNIGLKKSLALLYPQNLDNYPIIKKSWFIIDINILKEIYQNNKNLFNFIIPDEDNRDQSEFDENNDGDNKDYIGENIIENDEKNNDIKVNTDGNFEDDSNDDDYTNDAFIDLNDYLDTLITMNDIKNSSRHPFHDEIFYIRFDKTNDYFNY